MLSPAGHLKAVVNIVHHGFWLWADQCKDKGSEVVFTRTTASRTV
jgi:hypothetical protein